MQKVYPYTLDEHLKSALKIAMKNKDIQMVDTLWKLFVSYRKSSAVTPNV